MSNNQTKQCSQCGAPISKNAKSCMYCGSIDEAAPVVHHSEAAPVTSYTPRDTQPMNQTYQPATRQAPRKDKTTAGLLAIFLGSFGIHKFYLGKPGLGILYLLFFWTYIPSIIGLIEGIIYLSASEEDFQRKHG